MANQYGRTCTFAGHRRIESGIREETEAAIRALVEVGGVREFLCGGMGEFDAACAAAVRRMKAEFPQLRLCLVLPSMSKAAMDMREMQSAYDEIVIPEESDQAHFKQRITLRNRFMVDASDIVLACVRRNYGGAYQTARYAAKKKKPLLFVREKPEITQRLFSGFCEITVQR